VSEPPFEPVSSTGDAFDTHPRHFYPRMQVFPAEALQQGDPIGPEFRKDTPMKETQGATLTLIELELEHEDDNDDGGE
jgi:hypothetical protein